MFLWFGGGWIVWLACVIGCAIIAQNKNRNPVGWVVLAVFFPIPAVLIIALLPSRKEVRRTDFPCSSSGSPLPSLKAELAEMRKQVMALYDRIDVISKEIESAEERRVQPASAQPEPLTTPQPARPEPAVEPAQPADISRAKQDLESERTRQSIRSVFKLDESREEETPQGRRADMEANIGKFWLNKIGIVIFSLGIVFLLTYTFRFFSPLAKILFGYGVCAALFLLGSITEKKERLRHYGRVLLGGAWALAYFTTYAMHHFPASRVIASQTLDLILLAAVAVGIVIHSLRYRSQTLTAMALFIGYLSATLGDINYYTLANCLILSLVVLAVVYKMQWTRFIFLGIFLSYGMHLFWVIKHIVFSTVPVGKLNVENVYFLLDAGFLFIYWFTFAAAAHFIRPGADRQTDNRLAAANFANFVLFFFMTYPKFHFFYPQHAFEYCVGFGLVYLLLGLLMDLFKRPGFSIVDICIAVSLLTMAVPLKFVPFHTSFIWFVELPFLLFIGMLFERRVYRYLSLALAAVLFFKLFMFDNGSSHMVPFPGLQLTWTGFLSFIGTVSCAVCYWLYHDASEESCLDIPERSFKNIYSFFSTAYFTLFLYEAVAGRWFTPSLIAQSSAVLVIAALLNDAVLRYYGFTLLAWGTLRFWFIDDYSSLKGFIQLVLISPAVVSAYTGYAVYRLLSLKGRLSDTERVVEKAVFYLAALIVMKALIWYVPSLWITLSMIGFALLVLGWGVYVKDPLIRFPALAVLSVAGTRFWMFDSYRRVSELTQFGLISAKLCGFYAAYFIYRFLGKRRMIGPSEHLLGRLVFYAAGALVIYTVFAFVQPVWITVSLQFVALSIVLWGVFAAERNIRFYGVLVLVLAGLRFCFFDTYAASGDVLRWSLISSKVLLAFIVYFIYRVLRESQSASEAEAPVATGLFYGSSSMLVFAIFSFVKAIWISLALGIAGVIMFLIGFVSRDKLFRMGGFIVFGITLLRIVIVDLAGLPMLYKIVSFIVLGMMFLAVSFVYTKYFSGKSAVTKNR